jgi:hypothetical protein
MKYLCLGYYDERKFAALSPAEVEALVSQCPALDAQLRASGQMRLCASLGAARESISLRPRNGKPVVTDGPYAEAKEILGSFFIIDAETREQAIAIASKHPAAQIGEHVGWGVEIRPIDYYEQS